MSTDVFNCPKCDEPFDCKDGEPNIPGFDKSHCRSWCLTCFPEETPINRGLMEFLDQPAFKKTDKGYDYTLPINYPACFGCDVKIKLFEGAIAFLGRCGHYHCRECYYRKRNGGKLCNKCNTTSKGSECYPDTQLAAFIPEIVKLHSNEFREKVKEINLTEAKKDEDRKNGALQNCSDCSIEQPVERLFNCKDCQKVLCDVCVVDSHQGHAVVKLLGIEIGQMEQRNDSKYTENLEGLHGNLKYIQTTIEEGRFTELKACTKHGDAQKIVAKVDNAADKFEKHCEVYIPVARQLATRPTELDEDLSKKEE